MAQLGPFNPEFWFTERPIGTPLLLWLCGLNTHLFFLAQTLLFALSVTLVCHTVFNLTKNRIIAWVTVAAITALSVNPRFGLWHLEVLSESLGLSLGLMAIALWLRVAQQLSAKRVRWATFVTIMWVITRDAHVVYAVVIILVLLLVARKQKTERSPSKFCEQTPQSLTYRTLRRSVGALILTVLYVVTAQSVSERNQYPLMNNIGLRVLPNEEMTEAFVERGMPLNGALTARTGSDTWDDDESFLRSPELAEFRSWVTGSGQLVQMTSLIIDADFWVNVTGEVLPSALVYDFQDYDRFETSQRLPRQLFWFDGIRSPVGLGVVMVLAVGIALALITQFRKRAIGIVLLSALAAAGLDLYLSATGDAVEVLRHLIGPMLRLSVLGIVALGLGADWVLARWLARRHQSNSEDVPASEIRRRIPFASSLAASTAVLGIFVAWNSLELRTQDFDPQYARVIIERAAAFGGTYYQNGIHNKGPLETAIYDSARLFTSYETYWFAISAYAIFISALLGLTAWLIVRSVGASRPLAAAAGSLVAIHFSLSSSDYAGVIYSRNITTALLAAVMAGALWSGGWTNRRRATITFILCGIALGLAIQTLLTTALAATVVGLFVIVHRGRLISLRHPFIAMTATVGTTVLSAPLWYAGRGSFNEFWAGWWTYARFMSAGTGRSLIDQFGLGVTRFIGYYQDRPIVLLGVLIFAFITWNEWAGFSVLKRRLHLTLLGWFLAAWVELFLAQRYSSHYFSVIAVPSAFMMAIAVMNIFQALTERRALIQTSAAPPVPYGRLRKLTTSYGSALTMSCLLIAIQGTDLFWAGVERASRFRTTADQMQQNNEFQSGDDRTSRAVMDLVSTRGDALLAWTMYPWTYLEHDRVPASRFIWKSFMIGEIYLGRTSSEYVLDETWDWFTQDLAESRPKVFARPIETALVEGIPFNGIIDDAFTTVYTGPDLEIRLSRSLWDSLRSPVRPIALNGPQSPLDLVPASPQEIGWAIDLSRGTSMNISADDPNEPLFITSQTCRRIDGKLVGSESTVRFQFIDPTGRHQTSYLGLDHTKAWSANESFRFLEHPFTTKLDGSVSFSLLIGPQSAALIVGSEIVAAVRLSGPMNLALDSNFADLDLRDVTISPANSLQSC